MQRTLNDLIKEVIKAERKVKIIDKEGYEYTGDWYEDHMLDVYCKCKKRNG